MTTPSFSRLVALLGVLLAMGCGQTTSPNAPLISASTSSSEVAKSTTSTFPLTVTDGLKRSVTFARKPERIVSLAPKNTEMVYAFGLGKNLVGNTSYCNFPEEAKTVEKVGGFSARSISLEKVVALKPDVVLAAGALHQSVINELERLEIPVLALGAESHDELYEELTLLGRVTGHEEEAADIVEKMQTRIGRVQEVAKRIPEEERVTVFYLTWDDPLMGAGPKSLAGQLITLCGAKNLIEDVSAEYPQISQEALLARDPQVIVAPQMASLPVTVEGLRAKPGWENLRAFKENRVHVLNGDLMSRCGPRLVEALEQMAHAAYPERFPLPSAETKVP